MTATDAFRTPAAAPTYGHLNTTSAGLDGGNRSMIPLSDAARIPLPDLAEMLRIRLRPSRVDPPGGLADGEQPRAVGEAPAALGGRDLGLAPGASVQELERAVAANVLAVAELVGTYQR